MTSWEGPLTALVERSYLRPLVALESVAHYAFHDRVIWNGLESGPRTSRKATVYVTGTSLPRPESGSTTWRTARSGRRSPTMPP